MIKMRFEWNKESTTGRHANLTGKPRVSESPADPGRRKGTVDSLGEVWGGLEEGWYGMGSQCIKMSVSGNH